MDILKLKNRLNELGFGHLATEGSEALIAGPKTAAAVSAFQTAKGLKDTSGKIGPETLHALFPDEIHPPAEDVHLIKPWKSEATTVPLRALDIMLAQVGVKEVPDNAGPAVATFLGTVGLGTGYSWCMAFVYWAFEQAARELGQPNPLPRKTAGCMAQLDATPSERRKNIPQPGDVFIIDLGKGAGHTGVVKEVYADSIVTVEGNTNDDGSANGDGVYIRQRKIARIAAFIRS